MLRSRLVQPRRTQRGMSLVELMVGVVIGLLIVAAATVMAASQLTENRSLLLETQVQQDMRAAMEMMTRDIRRAGYSADLNVTWTAATPNLEPAQNPYSDVNISASGQRINFKYQRPFYSANCAAADVDYFLENGVVKAEVCGIAEPITDGNAMTVTTLQFRRLPLNATPLVENLTCPKLCANGTENCWPTFSTQDIEITMVASPIADPTVVRTMVSRVRPRSDAVTSGISTTQMCPP